jgi:DtxR family Mn-dependent transcriptional regulator
MKGSAMTDAVLSESLEDYLEAIFHIVAAKQAARASDISDRLGVKRSSVTGALRALAERGLVNYAPYDIITLTEAGRAEAMDVVHRHGVLRDFFVEVLGMDEALADEAACGMEHHAGKVLLGRLAHLAQFVCGSAGADGGQWLADFREFCRQHDVAVGAVGAGGGTEGDGEGRRRGLGVSD